YLEVVDVDPASNCCYAPVDLDDRYLLAESGLDPDEGNPQFHQQMVYAVAMTTIRNFERALGRRALWSQADKDQDFQFVRRLRIYPHAIREPNAYYDPNRKALLFGYFPAVAGGRNLPGGTVFSCLSHDVVAHETTHALLDGLHRRFMEPTNVDSKAFHEGFADIVALFQHFSFPAALRDQIRKTRGDLASQSLLGQLAQQFGEAIGQYGALRDALGEVDPATKEWRPKEPNPEDLGKVREAHERGSILVAAVFDSFLAIYRSRIADLVRIATAGTGVLPPGDIHPDLVDRLAGEAASAARHVLTMCIRALDYCPPVDLTFGDYLRALVTADRDLVPDDDRSYRIAIVDAFRRRGIYPQGVRTLSTESLCWAAPPDAAAHALLELLPVIDSVRGAARHHGWSLSDDRQKIRDDMEASARAVHGWLLSDHCRTVARQMGLSLGATAPLSIERKDGVPKIEVHSVRPARRHGPDGQTMTDLVIEVTQKRRGYLDPILQDQVDKQPVDPPPQEDFWFRGGCTLLVDLEHREVRYLIGKDIESVARLAAHRAYFEEGS
ncbi:MAG TPA: peptidase S8, partial [Thermoanaerobaculia bacterium]|nr:peptidase S8 [Thermoanaerobaculia bacterium]